MFVLLVTTLAFGVIKKGMITVQSVMETGIYSEFRLKVDLSVLLAVIPPEFPTVFTLIILIRLVSTVMNLVMSVSEADQTCAVRVIIIQEKLCL